MTVQPLVSVVVIFNNGEPYLEEAIQSVLAQTYPAWELLLVDDGSTDGSTARARRHADTRPTQIRYFEHEGHQNRGMSASRNVGIRAARGAYIALLDADDVWLPAKLDEQVQLLTDRPDVTMVYGASLYWHSWMDHPGDGQRDRVQSHRIPANAVFHPPSLIPLYLTGAAAVPCPTSLLVRTEAVREVGGFEETFQNLYEDQVFFAKICLRYPVFVATTCWDRYRQHPASASARGGAQRHLAARSKYLTWLAGYMREHGIDDVATWRTLRLEQRLTAWPYLARLIDRWRHRLWRWRRHGGTGREAR